MTIAIRRLIAIICSIGSIILVSNAARAQYAVKSGETVRLHSFIFVDTLCKSIGPITISRILDPQHGTLSIVQKDSYPRFPPGTLRYACNTQLAPATSVFYKSTKGQTGLDRLAFDVVFPLGGVKRFNAIVAVQ